MVVGATAAAAFAKSLATKNAVASTAALKQTMDGLNQAYNSGGVQQMNGMLSKFSNIGLATTPFSIMIDQIQAGTTQESVALMQQLFEVMQSDTGKQTIALFTQMLNIMISQNVSGTVTNLSELMSQFGQFNSLLDANGGSMRFLLDVLFPLDNILKAITITVKGLQAVAEKLDPALNKVNGWLQKIFDKIEENAPAMDPRLEPGNDYVW